MKKLYFNVFLFFLILTFSSQLNAAEQWDTDCREFNGIVSCSSKNTTPRPPIPRPVKKPIATSFVEGALEGMLDAHKELPQRRVQNAQAVLMLQQAALVQQQREQMVREEQSRLEQRSQEQQIDNNQPSQRYDSYSPPDPNAPSNTLVAIGDSKNRVLEIQGQPTAIYEGFRVWYYGSSFVQFDVNDKVKEISNKGNLKTRQ